ncbi:MAG: thiamine biosynthesis lipoprotein [Rhodothermales bacterium]|jgi:thiamine biosynthesis lipoprotein
METTASVLVYATSREAAQPFFELAFDEIERVEQLLSDTRPTSELSRINGTAGQLTVDPEIFRVVNRAIGWARQSGGAFDPTIGPLTAAWGFRTGIPAVPSDSLLTLAMDRTGWQQLELDLLAQAVSFGRPGMQLDSETFQKGYALDAAAAVMQEAGVGPALLSMGGRIYRALDAPPGQPGWLINVNDPTDQGIHSTAVHLAQAALSTSGNAGQTFEEGSQTFGHILDPRTGSPSAASIQVTVITDGAMDADALSAAVFVLGFEAAESMLAEVQGVQAMIIHDSTEGPELRTIRWATGTRANE